MHWKRRVFICTLFILAFTLMGGQVFAQDRLVVVSGTDAVTLDAHHITDSPSATVVEHIVEPLLEWQVDGTIVPKLAESYTVSDDGRVWTLNLRQGISFHDGTPFNAEAVKYNIERITNPANPVTFAFLVDSITSVEVVDEYTVQFVTDEPFAPMINHLTHSAIGMQSPAAIERLGDDEYSINPVGTGPFVFDSWVPGDEIVLKRNDNYWGEPAKLDEVVFRVVPEDGPRMLMVSSGEAQVGVRVPPEMVDLLEQDPNIEVVRTPSVRTIYVAFNNYQRADAAPNPFADPRVRQAVNYAVDNEAINDFILSGVGQTVDSPVAPGVFGYQPIKTYDYNPERAKELLAEAGYPNGFSTELYAPNGRYLKDMEIAEAIQAMLSDVGINAEIRTADWATYLEMTEIPAETSTVPMAMVGWGTVTGDADYGLFPMFHTSEWVPKGSSRSFYSNAEVDRLLEVARTNPDLDVREQTYYDAMSIIMEEAPWIFLHAEVQLTAVRTDAVDGVVIHQSERVMAHEAELR